ncbi:hypothetical protein Taro_055627 [Colocasia esculenta]|uniref:Uncharacterized protein n=1 Tax=Colocasia esculenta TaxID=4460 RepID=A0A843XTV6_COLES|nr:hypothetical protein [Colocasia esculenta]
MCVDTQPGCDDTTGFNCSDCFLRHSSSVDTHVDYVDTTGFFSQNMLLGQLASVDTQVDCVDTTMTNFSCWRDGREAVDHLLGVADPDADFTATDFRHYATHTVESILEHGRLPIVAGGSNSFIGALVDGNDGEFRRRYDYCFQCVDIELTELDSFVSRRVDYMVEAGLVEEVRGAFRQDGDYSKGIKRAIGVPEMDRYFRVEATTDKAPGKSSWRWL